MGETDRLAEVKALHFIGQITNADVDWLVGEVERLRALFGPGDYQRVWNEVVAERNRLRELLARLEWAGAYPKGSDACCPVCEAFRAGPHAPDCWLAEELGR